MPTDPYVYPGTDCLRNRAGIRDRDELERFEAEQTSILIAQLEQEPLQGSYDLDHLTAVHRRLFGEIYDWAGQLRTVVIAKQASVFALPEHIERYLRATLSELADEWFLRGLDRDLFVDRLTHYHAELNAVHPFRDGNGRTQRAFLGQLAHDAGYHIAWERLDRAHNISAAQASLRGDNAPLREMLDELVEPLRGATPPRP